MATQRICSVEGCDKPAKSRGYCGRHYERWHRTGDPQTPSLIAPRNQQCAVTGCPKPPKGKHCQTHYRLLKLYGSTERRQTASGEAAAFVKAAILMETDDCIVWPLGVTKAGPYGRVGKDKYAHREVCIAVYGPPPFNDARACHSCGNSLCVNKRHIRWGTAQDNSNDAIRLGELCTGERHRSTKLTDAQVFEIHSVGLRKSIRELAEQYGVRPQTISEIRAGRRACQRRQTAQ